jgi:hypothetical protein
MTQVKDIKTKLKIAKKTTPWAKIQRAKQIPNYDWKFGQTEEDLKKMASVLYQAVVLAKQGQKLSLVLPYCNISKIDLDLLQFSGTTNQFLAKKLGVDPLDTRSSLPELVNTYGKVHIMTEDGKVLGSDLEIREVEKEVIKEIKTVQSSSGIKPKDILKAIDNTCHQMSKTFQKDTVEAILNEFKKQLKI